MLDESGSFLYTQGAYNRAADHWQRAYDVRMRDLGADDDLTLGSGNNLSMAWQEAGEVEQATQLLEHVVSVSERVRGIDDPETLTSRNNLARSYQLAGDLDRATALYERTLADR